jgi:adenylate kinase
MKGFKVGSLMKTR